MEDVYYVAAEDRFQGVNQLQIGGSVIKVDQGELMELFFEREDTGDVQLFVEDVTLKAHKTVITSTSDYFKAMFRCEFVESNDNEVNVPNFSAGLVETFLKFVYTGEIHMTERNFQDVFALANQFQVGSLISLCVRVSTQELDWSNFGQHYADAHDLILQEHFDACHDFLATHFQELLTKRYLLAEIPPEAFLNVIARDDLRVKSEDDLVEIVINWVKLKPDEREPALTHILDQIRLPFVSMRELRRLCDAFDKNSMLKMRTLRRVMTDVMKKDDPTKTKARTYYQTAATPFLNYDGEEEDG